MWPERARSRRDPRDPGDEGARRGDHRAQGPRRPRAQARAGRDPRHRVRGAAAAARARASTTTSVRSPTTLDALARARRRRLRRARRRRRASTTRTGSCAPSSTGSSSTTSSRRTRSRPTSRRARAWPACSATATSPDADRARSVRGRAPRRTRPRCASIHERLFFAPLLDTLAGAGPLSPRGRRGTAGRLRLHRRRAHPRRRRASSPLGLTRRSRLMQQLLPGDPRLALRDARPRPRAAPAAAAGRRAGRARRCSRHVPRRARSRPSARAASSARAACVGDALRRHPEFVDALGDDDDARRRERPAPSWSTTRSRRCEWRGDAEAPARAGCAGSSGASCCGSRARDLLGFARLEVDRTRAHRAWPRRASRPRSAALEPPCRSP